MFVRASTPGKDTLPQPTVEYCTVVQPSPTLTSQVSFARVNVLNQYNLFREHSVTRLSLYVETIKGGGLSHFITANGRGGGGGMLSFATNDLRSSLFVSAATL